VASTSNEEQIETVDELNNNKQDKQKEPRGRRQIGSGQSLSEMRKQLEECGKPELCLMLDYMHKLLADHQKANATNFSR
jgi:hypothetical protein